GIGTIISFFISIIISPERWCNYSIAFLRIGFIVLIDYNNINENMKSISLSIKNLKPKNPCVLPRPKVCGLFSGILG
ncbi:MAG: hypothetical protein ACE5ES_04640, partial [Candidatus Nanoarchaeia archaeon]